MAEKKKDQQVHHMVWCEVLRRAVCVQCGLVRLKNEASRRAELKPCPDNQWDWRHD